MTVVIKLLPEGAAEVPAESRDHGILATYLEGAAIPNVPDTALSGWRDVERVVSGDGSRVELRVGGEGDSVADFPDAALDTISTAITTNISGLKPHPDGWHNVERAEQ